MKCLTHLAVALSGLLSVVGFGGSALAQSIPTSYSWTSTGPIISAKSDSTHNIIAVKDPSAVLYNGRWVIYASTVNSAGTYGME
jgi:endo-1,4-beta-xylanase